MQFQVPQFIEVEDKIFGPLTFKQFIYVIGGVGSCYLLWRVLPIYVAVPLILAVGSLAGALAFLQFNGRPFIVAFEHIVFYFLRSKLYLWNKERKRVEQSPTKQEKTSGSLSYIPRLAENKLHDLAWSLDIQERIQSGTVSGEDREAYALQAARGIVAPVRTEREKSSYELRTAREARI